MGHTLMAITLNDREEATCRIALQMLLFNYEAGLIAHIAPPLSVEEITELVHTMGPDSGKAFGEGLVETKPTATVLMSLHTGLGLDTEVKGEPYTRVTLDACYTEDPKVLRWVNTLTFEVPGQTIVHGMGFWRVVGEGEPELMVVLPMHGEQYFGSPGELTVDPGSVTGLPWRLMLEPTS